MRMRNNDDDLLLPQHEDYYPNWYKTGLAGWGLTLNNGNLSNTLTKVTSFNQVLKRLYNMFAFL